MKSILRYCVRVQNNRSNKQPKKIAVHSTNYKLSYKKRLTAHLSMNNAV